MCAIAVDSPDNFVEKEVFPTQDPATTLRSIRRWLNNRQFDAVGVATFGPIDAKIGSAKYGFITSTPKPGWKDTNVIEQLGLTTDFKGIPFLFDTDVNAPALAEYMYAVKGGEKSLQSAAYITIGTGVGVGLVCNGQSVKGLLHPEAGHIQVKRYVGDTFSGTCPFHGDCIEGMCSTGALSARNNCQNIDLPSIADEDSTWDVCAYYIAQLCASLVLIASPEFIVIGGGVLNRSSLYPRIRSHIIALLNGYVQSDRLDPANIEQYIRASVW